MDINLELINNRVKKRISTINKELNILRKERLNYNVSEMDIYNGNEKYHKALELDNKIALLDEQCSIIANKLLEKQNSVVV